MSRKVSIQRRLGEKHPNFPLGTIWEGWELTPPRVGEIYVLFTEKGSVFRTSKVTQIGPEGFKTRNSMYSLLVIQDQGDSSENITQELPGAASYPNSPHRLNPR